MPNSADVLNYLYDRCLPDVYVREDTAIGKPLYRYLQALLTGGFEPTVNDINGLMKLVNPDTCPEEFFPVLYESFGLEYFPDVKIEYHRRFLSNYGELKRRRGTYSSIRFLVRVLTGLEVELSYLRGEFLGQNGRHLILELKARSIMDIINLDTSTYVIKQFIKLFIPYYITVQVSAEIEPQEFGTEYYTGNAITTRAHYSIVPENLPQVLNMEERFNAESLVFKNRYSILPIESGKKTDIVHETKNGNSVSSYSRHYSVGAPE